MNKGQITFETGFGEMLFCLAQQNCTIVEFGTHDGTGSTRCLYSGLINDQQHLFSVDVDGPLQNLAVQGFNLSFVTFIHGTIVKPDEFMPFAHPDPDSEQYWAPERDANAKAPYVLDQIPEQIDLLLLDGGEWTSHVEFTKLKDRCKVIALDDVNKLKSNKNWRARYQMMLDNWKLVAEDMNERNGWSVFRRPE